MQAQRLILETNQYGYLIQQPQLPANAKLEAIFLLLEENKPEILPKRQPSAKLSQLSLKNVFEEPLISDAELETSIERTAQQILGIPQAFE